MRWRAINGVVACALALGTFGAAQAADNILVNGSFESGLASWTTSGFILEGYDYGVGDIAHSGSSAFYGGGIGAVAYLNQSVMTSVGQTYDVSFWLYSDGYLPNRLQVLADGAVRYDLEDVKLQDFTRVTTTFTATQTLTQLQFALRNDAGALRLDSIAVTAVPEPGTWALMAIGIGALALVRRRVG